VLPPEDLRDPGWFSADTLLGTFRIGNSTMNITDGKVIGDTLSFVAGDTRYTGRVNGNVIDGISQTASPWRATR